MEEGKERLVAALLSESDALQAQATELEERAARVRSVAQIVYEQQAEEILETRGVNQGATVRAPVSVDEFIELGFGVNIPSATEEINATRDLVDQLTNRAGERLTVVEAIGEITMITTGYICEYEPRFYLSRTTSSRSGATATGLSGGIGILLPTGVSLYDYSLPISKSRIAYCNTTEVVRSDDTLTIAASSGISHRGNPKNTKKVTRNVYVGNAETDAGLEALGPVTVFSTDEKVAINYLGVGKLFGGILQAEYDAIATKLPKRHMYEGDVFAPSVTA